MCLPVRISAFVYCGVAYLFWSVVEWGICWEYLFLFIRIDWYRGLIFILLEDLYEKKKNKITYFL